MTKESDLIKKAPDGTYGFRASLGFDKRTGKRRQKRCSGFKTKTLAKEAYRKMVAQVEDEQFNSPITFKEFCGKYFFPWYKFTVQEQTYEHRKGMVERSFNQFDSMKLSKITAFDVQKWQLGYLEDHANGTTRVSHTMLGKIFERAILMSLMRENPAKIVGNVKRSQDEVEFWTKDQFQKVIDQTSKDTYTHRFDFIILWFLFMTGMRSGEAKALTWKDVDLKAGTIDINKSLLYKSVNNYKLGKTKNRQSMRVISIDPQTIDYLEEWYEDQRLMTRSEFVLSQDGAPLNSTYINDIVHDYGDLAKVPTVTAHALRHSHASLLISLGENPLVIRDRLGHKDVRTTLEIYGHLYPKSDIEASKRLEGLVTVPSK